MKDYWTMHISELKTRVASSQYRVDELEVADAILRRPAARKLLLVGGVGRRDRAFSASAVAPARLRPPGH